MRRTTTARRRARRTLAGTTVGLVVVASAIAAILVSQPASSATTPAASPSAASWPAAQPSFDEIPRERDPSTTGEVSLTEADGILPGGATIFDEYPAIAHLRSDLLAAVRAASTDAAHDGVEFTVNSGWRSAEYQNQLLADAVAEYGSAAEAARWVATAETSAHVSGDAIDIEAGDAAAWLARHGAAYGLCQTYANESWHYELRPEAMVHGCPAPYADPTQDPRMQQ